MVSSLNLAARAGRWSAAHWKTAVAVWVAFVVVAIAVGTSVGTHKLSLSEQSTGETARAEQILASAGFKTPASEAVLVRSRTATVADPRFRATVQGVLAKLRTMPQVTNLRTGAAGEVSKDRRAQLIEFDMKGKAVLISGFTVLIAMAGMLFAGTKIFTSIGIGAMLVVFTSLVGSLTVLPALLGKLGDRYIERGVRQVLAAGVLRLLRLFKTQPRWLLWLRDTPTVLRRLKGDRQESRIWGFVLNRSMRFPAIATALSTAALVVLALPVLNIHTKLLSFTDLPKSLSIVKTYDTIQASFPGTQDPAHVVVRADNVTTSQFRRAYADFKRRALATGVIHQPIRVSVNPAKTVARVDFPLAGKGQDATAVHALETLRTKVIPPVLATLPDGTQEAVTGDTAGTHDFNQTMKSRAPL